MSIKPTAWMQELPKEEGVERAVRTTTVREVAEDWGNPIPLYTADDLQDAVLAEREACAAIAEKELGNTAMLTSMPPKSSAAWNILFAIRARGET